MQRQASCLPYLLRHEHGIGPGRTADDGDHAVPQLGHCREAGTCAQSVAVRSEAAGRSTTRGAVMTATLETATDTNMPA